MYIQSLLSLSVFMFLIYDYPDDKHYAVKAYQGEYMTQYGWAEKTRGNHLEKN